MRKCYCCIFAYTLKNIWRRPQIGTHTPTMAPTKSMKAMRGKADESGDDKDDDDVSEDKESTAKSAAQAVL